MARVDVAMQASPEITWPEDLPRGKKGKARNGSEESTHKGQETNKLHSDQLRKDTFSRKSPPLSGQNSFL